MLATRALLIATVIALLALRSIAHAQSEPALTATVEGDSVLVDFALNPQTYTLFDARLDQGAPLEVMWRLELRRLPLLWRGRTVATSLVSTRVTPDGADRFEVMQRHDGQVTLRVSQPSRSTAYSTMSSFRLPAFDARTLERDVKYEVTVSAVMRVREGTLTSKVLARAVVDGSDL